MTSGLMASATAASIDETSNPFRESPDATLVTRRAPEAGEQRIVAANDAFCALYDYPSSHLVGQPVTLLDGPDGSGSVVAAHRRAAAEGCGIRTAAMGYRRDRRAVLSDWTIWPERDAAGTALRWIAVAHAREAVAGPEATDLDTRLERERLEDLGRLVRSAAHDFNNLLTVAIANTELALQELDPAAPTRALLEPARDASRLAGALGEQLLRYGGGAAPTVEALDLSALVSEMTPLLELVGGGRARLRLSLSRTLPAVWGSRAEVAQVVLNLVANAFEAVEGCDDAGRVEIETGESAGARVFVDVRDDGPGFDAATRTRVVDPFFSTRSRGRGLGLATAVEIVERYGGRLEIASAPGSGARFRASFPASARRDVDQPGPAPPAVLAAAPSPGR